MMTTKQAEQATEKSKNKKLNVSRFHDSAFVSQSWTIHPEQGTTNEDLLDPSYWGNVSTKLRPNDFIRAFFEDGSRFVELVVMGQGATYAKVKIIREVELDPKATESPSFDAQGHIVKHRGPHEKWSVLDTENKVLRSKFSSADEAHTWLRGHLQTLAA